MDGFTDVHTREVLLDELGPRVAHSVARHPSVRAQADALVRACLSIPGALQDLADVLAAFQGETRSVLRLREFAARFGSRAVMREEERRELLGILRDEPGRPWLAAYLEAVGPVAERPPEGLAEAIAVLDDLAAPPDGIPQILRFTLALTTRQRGAVDVREALARWSERIARRLGVPLPRVSPHVPADAWGEEDVLLVLRLQPYRPASTDCLLSAWLGYGEGRWLTLAKEDEPRPLTQIATSLGEFWSVAEDYAGGRPPTRVEFVLPRSLLNLPVDHWRVRGGGDAAGELDDYPLGARCPVVLRDLERAVDPLALHRWERRWEALQREPLLPESRALWLTADRAPGQVDWPELDTAVAVIVEAPPRAPAGAMAEALELALDAGVPVALWQREADRHEYVEQPGGFHAVARELVHGGRGAQLPERLRELRHEALHSPHWAVGRHIALLWDDPRRSVGGGGELRCP